MINHYTDCPPTHSVGLRLTGPRGLTINMIFRTMVKPKVV